MTPSFLGGWIFILLRDGVLPFCLIVTSCWLIQSFPMVPQLKRVYDSTPAHPGVALSTPFRRKAQNPALASTPPAELPHSREVILIDDQPVTSSSPPLVVHELEGCYALYVGLQFDLHRDLHESQGDAETYQPWEPCLRLNGPPLVKGSSVMDPNPGIHLLADTCPPVDKTPMVL